MGRSSPFFVSSRTLAAALAAFSIVLGGCIPRDLAPLPDAETPLEATRREVQSFLDGRSKSLAAGDVDGYLAALAPEARSSEKAIAEGSKQVPLSEARLALENSSIKTVADTLPRVRVAFTFRYEGLPEDNVFRIPLSYDLVRAGKGWKITSATVQESLNLPAWATGQVTTARSEHFLALFRPGVPNAQQTLRLAEDARRELQAKLTFPLESSYVIVMAKDRSQYEQMSSKVSPASTIAQAETSFEVTESDIKVQSRQMVVNLDKLYQQASATEIFRHELGHLALGSDTRPFTPAWVSESAAMFLAGTKPTSTWREGIRRKRFESISFLELNRASSLGQHDPTGEAASYEYAYSAAAAYYLIQAYGPDKYWEFYRSYSKVSAKTLYDRLPTEVIASESDEGVIALAVETTSNSMKEVFGIDEPVLDAQVRKWIYAHSRGSG